jgi:hypothetical protein
MLGVFFIYLIGKPFYELAEKHNRNGWGYAFLGVFTYYVGTFIGGMAIGLASYFLDMDFDGINDLLLSLMAIPFGLFVSWLTYTTLKDRFTNNTSNKNTLDDNILDEGI